MYARTLWFVVCFAVSAVAVAGPKIEHWTLPNGARVYFVPAHELPMVQMRAVFDAGSSRDPAGKPGLARLVNGLLDEGAAGLSADEIARRFENLGAEFGSSSDRDMVTVDLRSLSDSALLDPALDMFARILSTPTFPQENLERQREQALVGLQKEAQSPGAIADRKFFRALYGTHPYAQSPSGDEPGLKAIVRDDLVAFHKRFYVGANAWFVIVGDVSEREAKRIAKQLVGQLPTGEKTPPLPPPPALAAAQEQRITFPASQTHVQIGQPGMRRGDPDYFPLYVGNYILGGGGLVSRLSDEVREKKGLSYSVYSYFMPLRVDGPFMLGLQTKNTQRDEAVKLLRQVLADFVAKGPTDKEMEAAKKHITGGFPLRIDSNGKIAEYLAVIGFYDLPLTYLDDFIPRVEAVTAEQVRDAFRRRIHPDKMATVMVGGER